MKKYNVAFIGTGGRSNSYASVYSQHEKINITAIADPVKAHRQATIKRSGISQKVEEYEDYKDMLKNHSDLDGVVISTPNYLHAEHAIACLELGIPVALEKPVATTKKDCERIIACEKANNGRTLIGFVLRSTPFYGKIHELITNDAIGAVTSIQADELPGWGVSSIMNRSPWRRYTEKSGGVMLEKSCHDMDLFNWMIGSFPSSLCSFGSRLIFKSNPELPRYCKDCNIADTCKYNKKPQISEYEEKTEDVLQQYMRDDDGCIYNIDKDGVDVQNTAIEYQNGVIVNFMLNFNTNGPKSSRNFHAIGLKGRIWGNLHENIVYCFNNQTDTCEEFKLPADGSDHGGGGRIHALELLKIMKNPAYKPDQNAGAGYLSAVMCFAADISRLERRRVDFAYRSNGYIDII